MSHATITQTKVSKAALAMIASTVSFAIMGGFVKQLRHLPTWEVVFFRSLVNLVFYVPWVIDNRNRLGPWRKDWLPLLIRGVSGCTAMALYFYAIENMRLADAVMLNYSSPIVVLVFSAIILKERLSLPGLLFVAVAFIGVGFILKPDAGILDLHQQNLAALAGFISAFVAAIAYISIKMATRSIHPNLIVFTFALVATVMSAIPMAVTFHPLTIADALGLIATGAFATLAQTSMTRGYAGLPASVASPMMLLTVVFSAVIGWVFWNEVPDHWSIIGSVLVGIGLLGAYQVRGDPSQRKWFRRRSARAPADV